MGTWTGKLSVKKLFVRYRGRKGFECLGWHNIRQLCVHPFGARGCTHHSLFAVGSDEARFLGDLL